MISQGCDRMGKLSNDAFLNELHKLYERNRAKGSIWVTMKRSNDKPARSKKGPGPPESYQLLVRAVDRNKKQLATLVEASQYAKFAQSMNVILKANMDALKKKVGTAAVDLCADMRLAWAALSHAAVMCPRAR